MQPSADESSAGTHGPVSDWRYPEPRAGWMGTWDRFVGPGATTSELFLAGVAATVAAIVVSAYAGLNDLGWAWHQHLVAIIIAFDLVGGVVTNATPSAKRWYHRKGQGPRELFRFVAGHAIQVAAIAFVFQETGALVYFLWVYLYVLLASAATLLAPIKLQRSVALLAVCGAVMLADWVLPSTPGLEWFLPVLTLKLVVSHATREEPYFRNDAAGSWNAPPGIQGAETGKR